MPSLVKFSHVFSHHEHTVCEGDYALHFHEFDIDCEFYKFKLNNAVELSDLYAVEFTIDNFKTVYSDYKSFLKNKKLSNCYQRGPPDLLA